MFQQHEALFAMLYKIACHVIFFDPNKTEITAMIFLPSNIVKMILLGSPGLNLHFFVISHIIMHRFPSIKCHKMGENDSL